MYIIIILILGLIIYSILQYQQHLKRLNQIPIRIHVNGTRGKSSVTRLIAGGLREGGIKTIAKTTGTLPRLILEDGDEIPIYRKGQNKGKGKANIIEQLKIVEFAQKHDAQALVIECMAVNPALQWISENRMVRSTIGVMTNVRLDHIEEMGRTLEKIAYSLCNTLRKNGLMYTAEDKIFPYMKQLANKRNAELIQTHKEDIEDEMMKGFSYLEHKENVALALAVCERAGVDRKTALKGMYKAKPDPGALEIFNIDFFHKHIAFANAFAANDPMSTAMIWKMIVSRYENNRTKIIILNTRGDRLERAQQLLEVMEREMEYDYILLIGDYTDKVAESGTKLGIDETKMFSLGWIEEEDIFEKILDLTTEKSLVVGIGNMGGLGGKVVEFLKHRA